MKGKTKLRFILMGMMLMIVNFCGVWAQKRPNTPKVILYGDTMRAVPDFAANFDVLRKNRFLYNAYNDSIFLIQDHDQWVNFFRRRAVKNHQIFAANKVALSNIFDYFKQDTVPSRSYGMLARAFDDRYLDTGSDPFVTYDVCSLMQQFCKNHPDSLLLAINVNYWHAAACVQLANLGKDSLMYVEAYHCLKNIVDQDSVRMVYYNETYPLSLNALTQNIFLLHKVMTIQEHNMYFDKLKKWMGDKKVSRYLEGSNAKTMNYYIRTHDENLVRNVYMTDSTVLDKQIADSLMRAIVKRNLENKNLNDLSYVRTLTMQVKLGQITASQAVDLCLKKYNVVWKSIRKRRLSADSLRNYILPFYSFFYLNDLSDKSFSQKRSIVKRMSMDIESAYQHRKDQQKSTDYVSYLRVLTTYPRVTKYLKPDERVRFLNSLNVATQVTTYAHSVHVSMIAEELMKGVLQYQPELLVGALGDLQVSEILRHKKRYLEFIHDAGMYHDIGKNSIASVVNNDYRPLTDAEFAIIKTHPELGLNYLKLSPALEKFHDTTLGHHKWYNGKGGYPDSFDNTQSPKRILIDIVTLSDCMQAATERIGRNYKGDKNFDTVMGEFRRDAGVRYNPDLVSLIDAHPDLAKKLSDLIDDGWVEIYYNIYSQFFVKQ